MRISSRFGQYGEVDLLFYKDCIVVHLIDRCTMFRVEQGANHSAIGAKTEDVLIDFYSTSWVTHRGPFEILYVDGESVLKCER